MPDNYSNPGGDEDYYGDGGGENVPMAESEESADETGKTGLLPKDFFQSDELEPGVRCEIEVVRVFDDQVEVKWLGPAGEAEEVEAPMPSRDVEMAALME